MSTVLDFATFTLRRFYDDGLMQSVGALTYSTLLALVPLLVIAFAIFSAFPAFEAIQGRLQEIVFESLLPETSEDLRGYLDRFTANASELTAVGIVALVFSAVLLLSTIEATLNRIWRVERERPLLTRLLVFWTLLTLGPLLLGASFTVSSNSLAWMREWTGEPGVGGAMPPWLRVPFAALVQTVAFTAIFKLVPARPVRLRDAAIGGVIGGVGFEILKWGFEAFLANSATYTTIYGAVSAVPVFLIWTYACWTIVILGAVFAASLPDWRRDRAFMHVEQPGPPQILAAAVAVLGILARRARGQGGSVDPERLSEVIPLPVRDALMESLRSQGYIVETGRGRIALTRDLHATTLADLARDLGLALGCAPDRTEAPTALAQVLERLAGTEDDILGRPLIDFVDDPDREDGTPVTAVSLSSAGR